MNPVKFEVNANTQQAVTQVTNLFGALRQLLGPVVALGSAAGFVSLARQALNTADAIGKVSQVAGLAVKDFNGIAYAAKQTDIGLDSLKTGLRSFSQELVKSGQGGRNLKDALLEQARIFQDMPDGAAKATRAVQLFGRAGTEMIPLLNAGPQALEAMFERGQRLSAVNEEMARTADEFNDSLDDLHLAAQGLAGTLALSLLPRLISLINLATEGIVRFRDWTQESKTFEIVLKSIVVLLGTLATYKVGILAASGLSALMGFGTLASLKDFVALLQLMPAAALAAAAALGKFAAAIGAVTAAVTLAQGWWDMWEGKRLEQEAIYNQGQAIQSLTDALQRLIAKRREAGEMSEEEYQATRRQILAARELNDQNAIAERLREIKAGLNTSVPGAGDRRQPFTREEFDQLRLADDLASATRRLEAAERDLNARQSDRLLNRREAIRLELEELRLRTELTETALNDGAITVLEAEQARTEDLKTRVALMQELRDLEFAITASDPSLTEAQKYGENKRRGLTQDGADPNSLPEQMLAKWLEFQNRIGTIQQQIADSWVNVMGAAIDSTTNSIMGLIDGTMSWQDALRNVGRTILTEVIQSIVRMGVQFVMTHVIMRGAMSLTAGLGSLLGKKNTQETIANEAAKAPSLATNAASASIGSYGYAAIIGGILAVAALGDIMAAAMGGFREQGGPVEGGKVYVVGERGPELFVPPGQGQILNNRQTMAVMNGGTTTGSGGKSEPQYLVFFFDSEAAFKRFMESNQGKNIIVRHVNDSRFEVGMGT